MILHTLKPRPVLRIVRWVRNQWLLLSFSTFNTKLAGASLLSWWKAHQFNEGERWTEGRSILGQLLGRRRLLLGQAFPAAGQTQHAEPEVGILLVPSAPWKSPASSTGRKQRTGGAQQAGC